jgi:hypothetical protein
MMLSLEVWSTLNQTFFDYLCDSGAGEPSILIYTAGNALLGTIVIDDEASEVDGSGDLVLVPTAPTFTPSATGIASYANLVDRSGVVAMRLPCVESNEAVAGALAIDSLSLVELAAADVISLVIPAGDLLP